MNNFSMVYITKQRRNSYKNCDNIEKFHITSRIDILCRGIGKFMAVLSAGFSSDIMSYGMVAVLRASANSIGIGSVSWNTEEKHTFREELDFFASSCGDRKDRWTRYCSVRDISGCRIPARRCKD